MLPLLRVATRSLPPSSLRTATTTTTTTIAGTTFARYYATSKVPSKVKNGSSTKKVQGKDKSEVGEGSKKVGEAPPSRTVEGAGTVGTAASINPEPPLESVEPPPPNPTPVPSPAESDTSPPPISSPSKDLTPTPSLAQQYLDISPSAPPPPPSSSTFGERTGARSRSSKNKSSIEKKRQNLSRTLILLGLVGTGVGVGWLGREWESEEEKMKLIGRTEDKEAVGMSEEGGWRGWVGRLRLRGEDQLDYLNKPAWDPLLPPPLPEPHYRPYTLIVDLDDLLVHSQWDTEHGWRTAKRPGVDYFLAYLSQFYEIVLFTTQPGYTAMPIIEKIDPYGVYIPWKLYRESTRYKNKTLIKDLSYLGRPLSRTIILDTDPTLTQLQPSNAIHLPPWTGQPPSHPTTKSLISLIPFLEAIAMRQVKDVRSVLEYYQKEGRGGDIGRAYAEAEERERERVREKWEEEKERKGGWWSAALGALIKPPSLSSPPETEIERMRKIAQRQYLEEQKYWKDNEELIKSQMEEDRERQLKEMKGSLLGMMGLAGGPPGTGAGTGAQEKK